MDVTGELGYGTQDPQHCLVPVAFAGVSSMAWTPDSM